MRKVPERDSGETAGYQRPDSLPVTPSFNDVGGRSRPVSGRPTGPENLFAEIESSTAVDGQIIGATLGDTSQRPALTLDVALYEDMLDDPSLSAEERAAFIEALWSIVVCFVDLGFNVHPLQHIETPDKTRANKNNDLLELKPIDMVELSEFLPKEQFEESAFRQIGDRREEKKL